MTVLLDTDVLVNVLRGHPPAQAWLQRCEQEPFQIPGIVAMELVKGSRNAVELQQVQRFLSRFLITWPEASDFLRAYDLLAAHQLTSGLSIPDYLIAAMALTRSARLLSFNLKHFSVIQGLEVNEPYAR